MAAGAAGRGSGRGRRLWSAGSTAGSFRRSTQRGSSGCVSGPSAVDQRATLRDVSGRDLVGCGSGRDHRVDSGGSAVGRTRHRARRRVGLDCAAVGRIRRASGDVHLLKSYTLVPAQSHCGLQAVMPDATHLIGAACRERRGSGADITDADIVVRVTGNNRRVGVGIRNRAREAINENVEDSMSCVYGRVKNGRGDDSFLSIVTDTGSGLPIINARYAEGLGLEFLPLNDDQVFEINGAGVGKEKVRYYVYLDFTLEAQLVTGANDQLEMTLAPNLKIQLKFHLRFYILGNLAVPALWGGPEARNLELTDHYQERGLTIKSPLRRRVYFIPTVSFTHLTSVLMENDAEAGMKEVWDSYRPSNERLSSLCRGSESWNAAAILMPKTTTVINVVDEKGRFRGSTNECSIDQSEVDKYYGNMNIEVASSIHEGEAKIVLRNHSMYKINLACGTFRVKVNPIIVFPVLSITPTVEGGLPTNHV